jgi:hypothetical protein
MYFQKILDPLPFGASPTKIAPYNLYVVYIKKGEA